MAGSPILIADIGGTNMRFALSEGGKLHDIKTSPWPEVPSLIDPALEYIESMGIKPEHAVFACASAQPDLKSVRMVNVGQADQPYSFEVDEVRRALGLSSLRMINDFGAVALSIQSLEAKDIIKVGGGSAISQRPIGILGAGTGLGCSSLIWNGQGYQPVSGEGGHATIGGTNQRECALIEWLHKKFPHVSCERVLSGPGLVNLHEAIRALDRQPFVGRTPAEIMQLGLAGQDSACREALDVFCSLLGSVAGNLALILGSSGGIYIAGGLVPRMSDYLAQSAFRRSFSAKGRYHDYLEAIPTFIVTHPSPGLLGAAVAAQHG